MSSRQRMVELSLPLIGEGRERVLAELAGLGFTGFLEEPDQLKAYIPQSDWDGGVRGLVAARLAASLPGLEPDERVIDPVNWNALWEASLEPLQVGPFLVKPAWMDAPPEQAGRIVLKVEPRMSFGTGHHESTRLVLRALPELVGSGDRVLDAGTGSGILAIAAVKLGAARVVAFDIDEWAHDNAPENFRLNEVADRISFRAGTLGTVPEDDFDLVLANIELQTLIEMIRDLARKARPGGHLLLSGILESEREVMLAAAKESGLTRVEEFIEGEWWAVVLRR